MSFDLNIPIRERIVLDLCGGTGSWSKPYADAGYDVRLVTLPEHDVRTFIPPPDVWGVLAAPPCDQFSHVLSEKITRDLEKGMEIVKACQRIAKMANPLRFSALENPIGHLCKFLGRPPYIFQPWWFGDPWTKRTGIWGSFTPPVATYHDWADVPKNDKLYIRPGRGKPNMVWLHKSAKAHIRAFDPFTADTDAAFRSITPQGFARAFFKVNQ